MVKQIVSVGDLVLDLVLDVRLPVEIDQHQMSPTLQIEPGGAVNTIVASRHIGLDVAVLGTVGSDFQGQMIKAVLDEKGVNTSALLIPADSTTTTVIALTDKQKNGHVFLGNYGEGSSFSLTPTAQNILLQSDAVFMPGYTLIEDRLQALVAGVFDKISSNNIPFYFDVGPYLGQLSEPRLEQVLGLTDVLFLTEEEIPFVAQGNTDFAACLQILDDYPNMLIVLKTGAAGCQIMSQYSSIVCRGYDVNFVDAVGAGDSFAGAFMWAHLNGMSLDDCGRIANAMGAASVQKIGGGRNTPTCDEVQQILDANHVEIDLQC